MQLSPVLLHNKKAICLRSRCYLCLEDHPEFLQPLALLRQKAICSQPYGSFEMTFLKLGCLVGSRLWPGFPKPAVSQSPYQSEWRFVMFQWGSLSSCVCVCVCLCVLSFLRQFAAPLNSVWVRYRVPIMALTAFIVTSLSGRELLSHSFYQCKSSTFPLRGSEKKSLL